MREQQIRPSMTETMESTSGRAEPHRAERHADRGARWRARAATRAVQRKEKRTEGRRVLADKPFLQRPRPPAQLWFEAEAARRDSDPAMRSACETVETILIGTGSIGTMRGGPIVAAGKMTNGQARLPKSEEAILAKKWTFYLADLAHGGRGLDSQYNIVDATGRVLDTWWAERMR